MVKKPKKSAALVVSLCKFTEHLQSGRGAFNIHTLIIHIFCGYSEAYNHDQPSPIKRTVHWNTLMLFIKCSLRLFITEHTSLASEEKLRLVQFMVLFIGS